jgi:heme-degrading monooxygenase HmoA
MIIRIVKMEFDEARIPEFLKNFYASSDTIESFPGCSCVRLLRDEADPSVFFTYSHWDSEGHLNAYRESDFFRTVWGVTRQLFRSAPQAWSLKDHTFSS